MADEDSDDDAHSQQTRLQSAYCDRDAQANWDRDAQAICNSHVYGDAFCQAIAHCHAHALPLRYPSRSGALHLLGSSDTAHVRL